MAHRPPRSSRTFGVGEGLVALGAVAIVVSIFLNWVDFSHTVSGHQVTLNKTADGVGVQFLWDYTKLSTSPSLLVVLIPSALLCLFGIFLLLARWLALLGGFVALIVGLVFTFQLHQFLRAAHIAGYGLSDFLGIAAIICFVGGAFALIGGALLFMRSSGA